MAVNMNRYLEFFVEGIPYPKDKASGNKQAPIEWTKSIIETTKNIPALTGPSCFEIDFFIPIEKYTLKDVYGPDLDNLVKRLLDGLSETLFSGLETKDGSIIHLKVNKKPAIGDQKAGAKVRISMLEETQPEQGVHYFAHGQNMSTKQMKNRIPEARNPMAVCIPSFRLMTNKISADGSGEANLVSSAHSEIVWGVMWTLPIGAEKVLDSIENGYHRVEVIVFNVSGMTYRAFAYFANRDMESPGDMIMFDWYRSHLLVGALEHGLPENYLTVLESLPWRTDPDDERKRKNS